MLVKFQGREKENEKRKCTHKNVGRGQKTETNVE